jgi:hypothetical protein
MTVWGGHSCPPPLTLGLFLYLFLTKSCQEASAEPKPQNQNQNQEQHQRQRTGVSAPHKLATEKATLISERGLDLMPATTYSPTHFRVQYHGPSGA